LAWMSHRNYLSDFERDAQRIKNSGVARGSAEACEVLRIKPPHNSGLN